MLKPSPSQQPEQLYELSVKCARIVSRGIKGDLRPPSACAPGSTVEEIYVLGEITAVSAMHAVTQYWQNCAHKKPTLLNEDGRPVRVARLRRGEIRARPIGSVPTAP